LASRKRTLIVYLDRYPRADAIRTGARLTSAGVSAGEQGQGADMFLTSCYEKQFTSEMFCCIIKVLW
jgi:hypothetical protein